MTEAVEETTKKKPKLLRIFPQLKTFKTGTLLENKVDLYYSHEEDELEVGDGMDHMLAAGAGSFAETDKFIPKGTKLFFVEAAQFRGPGSQIYVRLHLIAGDKAVWTNLIKTTNKTWSFLIRSEQKEMIKKEIEDCFILLAEGV